MEVRTDDDKPAVGTGGVVTATADGKGNVIVTQTKSSRIAWENSDGSGDLVIEEGGKRLTLRDRDGKQVFSGPVESEEQINKLPPKVREQLERIERSVTTGSSTGAKE